MPVWRSSAQSGGPGGGQKGGSASSKNGPQSKVTGVPKSGKDSNRGDGKSGRSNPKR
jgi:hypothetical protein